MKNNEFNEIIYYKLLFFDLFEFLIRLYKYFLNILKIVEIEKAKLLIFR